MVNLDLDSDAGMLLQEVAIVVLGMVKAPHHWFDNRSKICRPANLRPNELKVALAEVCTVQVLLFWLQFISSELHRAETDTSCADDEMLLVVK